MAERDFSLPITGVGMQLWIRYDDNGMIVACVVPLDPLAVICTGEWLEWTVVSLSETL